MPSLYDDVDPFLGNEALDLPEPQGIAATWFLPKAQNGNTHPGACTPFGMVSVAPYSGAYITGYGLYRLNTHGHAAKLHNSYVASGFTHFHQSGTGNIRKFYNYVRVTPVPSDFGLQALGRHWQLDNEKASPGSYQCDLPEIGVRSELTCTARSARHQYHFSKPKGQAIVDLSVGGLQCDALHSHPESIHVTLLNSRQATGWILVEGVTIYFSMRLLNSGFGTLWEGDRQVTGRFLDKPLLDPNEAKPMGVIWQTASSQLDLCIGFSFHSVEKAMHNMEPGIENFSDIRQRAAEQWHKKLDVIKVHGGNNRFRQIFASALYHSLIKPVDISHENPSWLHDGDCFIDIATLWDQYKTHLPLIQTLYPDIGGRIANSFCNTAERFGDMPCGLIMAVDHTRFADQASCLAHQVWYGAWCRRLPNFDPHRALRLMVSSFHRGQGAKLLKADRMASPSHVMDLSQAAWCTARMAEGLGEQALVERFDHIAAYSWRRVFDDQGLLQAGTYYEGSRSTYSFRPFHSIDERIAISGGSTRFLAQLDHFFGYSRGPVQQPGHEPSDAFMQHGLGLGSFEGLNNEPDMETPYTYIFAGRPDKTAEVVRAICTYQFSTGRGGLPGNDDSGGLSSWFVWSAIGLFPISGTALVCIGSPLFDRITLPWCGEQLTILAEGAETHPYVTAANLNGRSLDRAWLRLDELAGGGTLNLQMSDKPSEWGQNNQLQLYPRQRQPM